MLKVTLANKSSNGEFNCDGYTGTSEASVRVTFILEDTSILESKDFQAISIVPELITTDETQWTAEPRISMPITIPTIASGEIKGNELTITFRAQTAESCFANGDQIILNVYITRFDLSENHRFLYQSGKWIEQPSYSNDEQ